MVVCTHRSETSGGVATSAESRRCRKSCSWVRESSDLFLAVRLRRGGCVFIETKSWLFALTDQKRQVASRLLREVADVERVVVRLVLFAGVITKHLARKARAQDWGGVLYVCMYVHIHRYKCT